MKTINDDRPLEVEEKGSSYKGSSSNGYGSIILFFRMCCVYVMLLLWCIAPFIASEKSISAPELIRNCIKLMEYMGDAGLPSEYIMLFLLAAGVAVGLVICIITMFAKRPKATRMTAALTSGFMLLPIFIYTDWSTLMQAEDVAGKFRAFGSGYWWIFGLLLVLAVLSKDEK